MYGMQDTMLPITGPVITASFTVVVHASFQSNINWTAELMENRCGAEAVGERVFTGAKHTHSGSLVLSPFLPRLHSPAPLLSLPLFLPFAACASTV